MAEPILWSAVNVSEGRDLDALRALANRLNQAEPCLADWSADADHHRSVFSLVGTERQLALGIEEIFRWASECVDLTRHHGVHPRLGAVDVVPFVPLSPEATLEDAQKTAVEIASKVAKKFNIPTFLYRDSSLTPYPRTLPQLRRGGLTQVAERMAAGELKPEFGPGAPHPALGVSVFGARPPLTAYNCLIDSNDLETGRAIAREIRESGGGVPHLQALAFPLESRGGRVQISMNLLDPKETPPHIAYLAVREACEKRGLDVLSSELIGLVPMQALQDAFKHFLRLESFEPSQTAEWHLLRRHSERTQQV